jgi:hypothetical protein
LFALQVRTASDSTHDGLFSSKRGKRKVSYDLIDAIFAGGLVWGRENPRTGMANYVDVSDELNGRDREENWIS